MSNGLPPQFLDQLRTSLDRADTFSNDSRLEHLFQDSRIALWRNSLPNAHNRQDRINGLISHLLPKQNSHQEYGLVLFLLVLRDNSSPHDKLHQEFDQLARNLNEILAGPPIPPLPSIIIPPHPDPPPPDPKLAEIQEQFKQGQVVLLIGGDLPANITGVPSKQELAQGLAAKHRLGKAKSLPWVAQQIMGNPPTRVAFTQYLQNQLSPFDKSVQSFQQAIVHLVEKYKLSTIFTTAYDQQLEDAFRQLGKRVARVGTPTQLSLSSPNQCTLIKLLGHWEDPENLLVTEQDLNRFIRGQANQKLVSELTSELRRKSLFMVGENLQDTAMLALLDENAGNRFQLPGYAIWSGLSQVETNSFAGNRNLQIIEGDPVIFLQALANHPLS